MNNDKTKTIIVSSLVVLLVGIGAFQFLAPKPSAAPGKKTDSTSATPTKPDPTAPGATSDSKVPDSPVSVAGQSGPDRTGAVGTALTPTGQTGAAVPTDSVTNLANQESTKLRDPFSKPSSVSESNPNQPKALTAGGAIPLPADAPKTMGSQKGGTSPAQDAPKADWVSPMNPIGTGSLPVAGGPSPMAGSNGAPVEIKPIGPRFRLKGVMLGKVTLAVLEDAAGNQHIVQVGDQCDADTKVVKITQGKVVLSEKGKEKTLTLEDKPN